MVNQKNVWIKSTSLILIWKTLLQKKKSFLLGLALIFILLVLV